MNIPYCTFKTRVLGSWQDVTTEDLFKNKKVVVFALPDNNLTTKFTEKDIDEFSNNSSKS